MDFDQAIMDGEVLGAFRAISAPVTSLLGALERLSENPVGVVPQQGGCHEVDPEEMPADMCPAFFPQKERTTLGTPKRRVALRLVRGRPVIDQLRDAVAKIEARA